jgi:hypothetical protein
VKALKQSLIADQDMHCMSAASLLYETSSNAETKDTPTRVLIKEGKCTRHVIVTKMHFFSPLALYGIPDHATPNTDTISRLLPTHGCSQVFYSKTQTDKKKEQIHPKK